MKKLLKFTFIISLLLTLFLNHSNAVELSNTKDTTFNEQIDYTETLDTLFKIARALDIPAYKFLYFENWSYKHICFDNSIGIIIKKQKDE